MWVLQEHGGEIMGSGRMLPHDEENAMQVRLAATDLIHRLMPEIKLDGGEISALTPAVAGRGFPYFEVFVRYPGVTLPKVYYLEKAA